MPKETEHEWRTAEQKVSPKMEGKIELINWEVWFFRTARYKKLVSWISVLKFGQVWQRIEGASYCCSNVLIVMLGWSLMRYLFLGAQVLTFSTVGTIDWVRLWPANQIYSASCFYMHSFQRGTEYIARCTICSALLGYRSSHSEMEEETCERVCKRLR